MRRPLRLAGIVLAVGAATLATAPSGGAAGTLGFGDPVYVDQNLAGGEPFVIHPSTAAPGRLIYTAHEGTTHLYRDGVINAPKGTADFITNYRNQVNIWTSDDNGASWQRVNFNGTGFFTDPSKNTGFSDPDLTEDAGGNVYNTGIDLANDALFSTPDAGRTWPNGTAQCHDGDRPWLAGAQKNTVYLATNTVENGHTVFRSIDAGNSCDSSWSVAHGNGLGKLYYDRLRHQLVEATYSNGVLGVGTLRDGATAFSDRPAATTTLQSHWPAIAIDSAGNYYLVWDTDDRDPNSTNGCGALPNSVGGPGASNTPLANSVNLVYSTDGGSTWSAPITVARQNGRRLLWPWVTAGAAGRVGVVWYQYDRVTDPDCGSGNVTIQAAEYSGITRRATRTVTTGGTRVIHQGGVCQGGTTCAVTGQDRRLGDYFTDALDANGCLIIASGDTTLTDPTTGSQLPTSRPAFFRQNSGPSLTRNQGCGTAPAATRTAANRAPSITALFLIGGPAMLVLRRRRRGGDVSD